MYVCLSINVSICISIYLCIYIYIYIDLYLFIYPSILLLLVPLECCPASIPGNPTLAFSCKQAKEVARAGCARERLFTYYF